MRGASSSLSCCLFENAIDRRTFFFVRKPAAVDDDDDVMVLSHTRTRIMTRSESLTPIATSSKIPLCCFTRRESKKKRKKEKKKEGYSTGSSRKTTK